MRRLLIDGKEADIADGTDISWKRTNILFAFDKAECERSLTFTLPTTPTNDGIFSTCRKPSVYGGGFRRTYEAEYIDGVAVRHGFAYVTEAKRSGYNVTLVVGDLVALQRLRNAGTLASLSPAGLVSLSNIIYDADSGIYDGVRRLRYLQADEDQPLLPSWSFGNILSAALDSTGIRYTLPPEVMDLRLTAPEVKGTDSSIRIVSTGTGVDRPDTGELSNTLSVTDNAVITAETKTLYGISYTGGRIFKDSDYSFRREHPNAIPIIGDDTFAVLDGTDEAEDRQVRWRYEAQVLYVSQACTLTFGYDIADDYVIKPLYHEGGDLYFFIDSSDSDSDTMAWVWHSYPDPAIPAEFAFTATLPAGSTSPVTAFDSATGVVSAYDFTGTPNVPLAGTSVKVPADTYIMLFRRSDYALAKSSGNDYIFNYQPKFDDFAVTVTVKAEAEDVGGNIYIDWQANLPDVTLTECLKALTAVTGTALHYDDVHGLTFEKLDADTFSRADFGDRLLTVKSVKPKFGSFSRRNVISYKDDNMSAGTAPTAEYDCDSAMLSGSSDILTVPFSAAYTRMTAAADGSVTPAIYLANRQGEKPSGFVLSRVADGVHYLLRQPLVTNATIENIASSPLTLEVTTAMTLSDFDGIKPLTEVHVRGVDYVWTEASWSKGVASLTLARITPSQVPLTYMYGRYVGNCTVGHYIDTGMPATEATRFEFSYYTDLDGTIGELLTCSVTARYNFTKSSSATGRYRFRWGTQSIYLNRLGLQEAGQVLSVVFGQSYSVSNEARGLSAGGTFNDDTFTTPSNIYIFNNSGQVYTGLCYIGEVRRYDGEELTQHFIPCKRLSDGAVGYHEVVSDRFFGDAGTGTSPFVLIL